MTRSASLALLTTTLLLPPAVLFSAAVRGAPPAAPPPAQPQQVPTDPAAAAQDIKAAYEKGDYQEALRLLGRVLSLKGRAAEGVDRYELLMIKAESHLRLKAQTNATQSLEEAAKIAAAAKDDKRAADARALSTLIKRSKNLQFTPRFTPAGGGAAEARPKLTDASTTRPAAAGGGGGGGALDITNTDQRKAALEALYADERTAARSKVQEASRSRTLPPVAAALKAVQPLKDLELAANGSDAETAEEVKKLVGRAHDLMSKGVNEMSKRTAKLAERANELVEYTVTTRTGETDYRTRRRGLTNGEQKELKGIVTDCKRVFDTCRELSEMFPDDAEPFEDLEDVARQTGEKAQEVVSERYS